MAREFVDGTSWCIRAIRWFPTLFVAAIVSWSYYAYVIVLCLFTVDNIAEKIIYALLFHFFLVLFLWSFYQIIFTDVFDIPSIFFLPPDLVTKYNTCSSEDQQRRLLEDFAKNLPVECRTLNGCIRYCEKCMVVKPDRAHHDSVTGRCVLKMDHYCPWVNNTVGFNNYKYFILFLIYAFLFCVYVSLSSLQYFIKFWSNITQDLSRFHILFLFFVAVMFAFALVGLAGYHLYLTANNKTTLESFRAPILRTGPDKRAYDLGCVKNYQQVFGDRGGIRRILPLYTTLGDGITYPHREYQPSSYSYRSMEQSHSPPVASTAAGNGKAVDVEVGVSHEVSHSNGPNKTGSGDGDLPPPSRPIAGSSDASANSQVSLLNEGNR